MKKIKLIIIIIFLSAIDIYAKASISLKEQTSIFKNILSNNNRYRNVFTIRYSCASLTKNKFNKWLKNIEDKINEDKELDINIKIKPPSSSKMKYIKKAIEMGNESFKKDNICQMIFISKKSNNINVIMGNQNTSRLEQLIQQVQFMKGASYRTTKKKSIEEMYKKTKNEKRNKLTFSLKLKTFTKTSSSDEITNIYEEIVPQIEDISENDELTEDYLDLMNSQLLELKNQEKRILKIKDLKRINEENNLFENYIKDYQKKDNRFIENNSLKDFPKIMDI